MSRPGRGASGAVRSPHGTTPASDEPIPEAWHDLPGGLSGPLVFVAGYVLVRLLHMVVYLVAAGSDRELRRQVVVSLTAGLGSAAVLLVTGALLGEPWQLWLWLAAICLDLLLVYVTSRGGNGWRLKSASHFAERFGLIVILALGESVIAIGVIAARIPVAWDVLATALLAVGLALGLWWSYFHHLDRKAEHELARRRGAERAALAVDAYTYLHFVLVAGIVVVAVGIEEAMLGLDGGHTLGWFAASCLGGGLAAYLAGTVLFWRRVSGEWTIPRAVGAVAVAALVPAFAALTSIAALGAAAVLLAALLAVEQWLRGRAALRRGARGAPVTPR